MNENESKIWRKCSQFGLKYKYKLNYFRHFMSVEVSIQQSRDRPVRLTGDSKLTTGVTVSDGLCLWVTGIDSRRPATLSRLTGYENAWKLQ